MSDPPKLWPDEELPKLGREFSGKNFKSLRFPLWTQNKAKLIQAYLRLFVFITKHGTYIDGFAAPQDQTRPELCSAKLVLEMEPKRLRDFWLCDVNPEGIHTLHQLRQAHVSKDRRITILDGDFNVRVRDILQSGQITEKTATFALLDQRTFECEWQTAKVLSEHKKGNKIELFYFFPTGWIDRSLAAVSAPETRMKVRRWWGDDSWVGLLGMDGTERSKLVAARFEQELKYTKAHAYPIHSDRHGGRVMYHMIHASDHEEAFPLMVRAYRQVSGRPEIDPKELQLDIEKHWLHLHNEN